MRFPVHAAATVALAVVALPAAADDLTIVSKASRDGGAAVTTTSYLSSDHARMSQADGQETILDVKAGQITVIDGKKREYYVVTRQDMDQLKARVQQTMNSPEMVKAREQMKSLPPEIQKRMQGMMGAAVSAVDVHKAGTSRKVAGYTCEDWTITVGQLSKTQECLTSELPLPVQAWDSYRDFADSMKSLSQSMGPLSQGMTDLQAKMKDVKGYPLATSTSTSVLGRSSTVTSEVTEIKKGPIPASAWEVPAGYRKVDNPMLKAMPRGR